jgi:RHS repeat-associated protein
VDATVDLPEGREISIIAPGERVRRQVENIDVSFNFPYTSETCYDSDTNIDPCLGRSVSISVTRPPFGVPDYIYWENGESGLPLSDVVSVPYDFTDMPNELIIEATASCGGRNNQDTKSVYPEECIDNDGDGFYAITPECLSGDDCDDTDDTVYPGATELCDGKDNNCDGQEDEGCANEPGPSGNTGNPGGSADSGGNAGDGGGGGGCKGGVCCPGSGGGGPGGDSGGDGETPGFGSPAWQVNMVNMNLYLTDTPLWYTPPYGPEVRIQLSYNSLANATGNEPFGNKWILNYGSYLTVDANENVTIMMPDGKMDVYNYDGQGGYSKPFEVFSTLTKAGPNWYELKFLDGTVYVYQIPLDTSLPHPYLVEIQDSYGQSLTIGYTASGQIETITDALTNNVTTFYDDDSDGLIDHVDDPFGRSALFEYDIDRNLEKITDMGGYWTSFTYDPGVYLSSITNSEGTWDIYIEENDGRIADLYPAPGGDMGENYRITITNPLGDKEEYFYKATPGAYSWYISPRDYVDYVDQNNNNDTSAPKTYYFFNKNLPEAKIRKIVYPEGGHIEFWFDPASGKPTTIKDYHGLDLNNNPISHITEYTHNSNGLPASYTDAKNNTTTFTYYPNDIDLWEFINGLGTITYTYNGTTHDVETVTDRNNVVTEFGYNTTGQLITITEAKGTAVERITELVYDPASYELSEIKRAGSTLITLTPDPAVPGRVKTFTDSTGLTLTYDYNNLDQITKITYPDTKFELFNYSTCCPFVLQSRTDRAGFTTNYTHDSLKRLKKIDGPGGIIQYDYDTNGNRTLIMDQDNKPTSFEYNLDNRLVKKIYADGKFIQYTRDLMGFLETFTNARNITRTYTYDSNHNVEFIDYSDATPDVTYTYDSYNRVYTRIDGVGIYHYDYYVDNRIMTIDGPWFNDMITFQYDDLGNITTLTPLAGQPISYYYDYDPENPGDPDIGRLKDITAGASTYTYGYTGINTLIQNLTRPNGSFTDYGYNDPLNRLTEIINKNSSGQTITSNSFTYTGTDLDVIDTETVENGDAMTFTEGITTYDYNNLNQLLSSANPNQAFAYDDDGNMAQGYNPDGYVMTMTYDAENRLTSAEYTDSGNVVHRTEYEYSGDNLLAVKKKFENGSPIDEIRYVRAGFLPIQERDDNNQIVREYTWGLNYGGGIGGLLNLRQGGLDYSYLYDGKGNVRGLIDSTNTVVAKFTYDEFGNLMSKVDTLNLDQPYMFSTKEYDEETGLSYYGFRFYSPSLGRWITRDPIEEAGGLNLYGFVGNNAVNWMDPLGLQFNDTLTGSPQLDNYFQEVFNDLRKHLDKIIPGKNQARECMEAVFESEAAEMVDDPQSTGSPWGDIAKAIYLTLKRIWENRENRE